MATGAGSEMEDYKAVQRLKQNHVTLFPRYMQASDDVFLLFASLRRG